MKKINFTSHKGLSDEETLQNIIADIEYLRSKGTSPWTGASGRRSMELRFTYKEALSIAGREVIIDLSTCASCNFVRFSVVVTIDGISQRQYLKALKSL